MLIVSADIASVGLDWTRQEAAAIFGDGAAAVVLGRADERAGSGKEPGLLALRMETWSEGRDAFVLAAGGTRVNPLVAGASPRKMHCFIWTVRQPFASRPAGCPDFLRD
ncbi:hypothetical protein [Paracoccus albus]|uniref:hypothetical protein n=1 Tax=Paracoccus albus TaxID=3017784 RepID=UPI00336A9408